MRVGSLATAALTLSEAGLRTPAVTVTPCLSSASAMAVPTDPTPRMAILGMDVADNELQSAEKQQHNTEKSKITEILREISDILNLFGGNANAMKFRL